MILDIGPRENYIAISRNAPIMRPELGDSVSYVNPLTGEEIVLSRSRKNV